MEPNPGIHMHSGAPSNDMVQVAVLDPHMGLYQLHDQTQNVVHHAVPQDIQCPSLVQQVVPPQVPAQVQGGGAPQDGSRMGQVPFAEVASLLDPNMKSSKARKYQIHYEEVKRRLEAPEKMSLRSLAAYTRVSRGPASKRTLLESLNIFGLAPSTNTAVSSSFSKLTEGDTEALCKDMKDFASQYMDYENMAKQLLPETNQVQHWSKVIETRNYLEEMRKCFHDPANSRTFNSATHGLGNGMLDAALDMIDSVIERQIRILSGNTDPKPEQQVKRVRKRMRKPKAPGDESKPKEPRPKREGKGKRKGDGPNQKLIRLDSTVPEVPQPTDMESSVLTLVSVGYETISSGLNATSTGLA